jgi:hypothetical protein
MIVDFATAAHQDADSQRLPRVASRRLWALTRNVGLLSQSTTERNVLAGNLVERYQKIIRKDPGSRDNFVV